MLAGWVPGEAVRSRVYGNGPSHGQREYVDTQHLPRAARRGEHEVVRLRDEDAAAFGTPRNGRDVPLLGAIEHLHGAGLRVGDEDPPGGEMHVAMVELARGMWRDADRPPLSGHPSPP